MAKHRNRSTKIKQRDAPASRIRTEIVSPEWYRIYVGTGNYISVYDAPEVKTCAHVYADMVSNMTIHLMQHGENGDSRVVNELSRKVDINPSKYINRKSFIYHIVDVLLRSGDGNCVIVPTYTADGLLDDLVPLKPSGVSFIENGTGYFIKYGELSFDPSEVLHFTVNPDCEQPWRGTGLRSQLRDIVKAIRQANATKNALLSSPAPSIIISIDGLSSDEMTPDGRSKLSTQYLSETENGKPWIIPAEALSVSTVKPLTISDLAIDANLELDKRSVAALYGVPAYNIGIGEYNKDEQDNFINLRIMGMAQYIQQEFTRKTILSPDWYWRFNNRSLHNYSLSDIITAGGEMVDRSAMTRNEWRDWVGYGPRDGMDELLTLENYIPTEMLGSQNKLKGGKT